MAKGLDPDAQVRDAEMRIVPLWKLAGLSLEPRDALSARAGVTETLSAGRLAKTGYRPPLQRGVYETEQLYADYEVQVGRGLRRFENNLKHDPAQIQAAIIALQALR